MMRKCVRDADRLHALQPNKVKNDVKAEYSITKEGNIEIAMERYKTRVRKVDTQVR